MTAGLATLWFLSTLPPMGAPKAVAMVTAEMGANVTLLCPRGDRLGDIFYWYKTKVGHSIETIAQGYFGDLYLRDGFKGGRFSAGSGDHLYFLNITRVSKDDEAIYTCQAGMAYDMRFLDSTHLLVKDPTQRSFYVRQSPLSEKVEAGQWVTLQCRIVSTGREVAGCPEPRTVYWFKSGSGDSSPHAIYTEGDEKKVKVNGSCVYRLSKMVRNSSDSGTYYCAVAACGAIVFGPGSHVETRAEDPNKVVGIVLGALLVSAFILATLLLLWLQVIQKKNLCRHLTSDLRQKKKKKKKKKKKQEALGKKHLLRHGEERESH
ncbi:uncharacterized protein LOC144207728 [Stigmatopora nigra]